MARPVEYSAVLLLPFTPYESLLCISHRPMYLVCACTWRTVFSITSPPLSPLQVIMSRCPSPGDKHWLRLIGIGKLPLTSQGTLAKDSVRSCYLHPLLTSQRNIGHQSYSGNTTVRLSSLTTPRSHLFMTILSKLKIICNLSYGQ